eukprot:49736-Chlamydomonas_euryale.AAC.6
MAFMLVATCDTVCKAVVRRAARGGTEARMERTVTRCACQAASWPSDAIGRQRAQQRETAAHAPREEMRSRESLGTGWMARR